MHPQLLLSIVFISSQAYAFPAYHSLVGMTDQQIDMFARSNPYVGALPPPGPLQNTSAKLVNDAKHPYIPPGPDDIRGPCPGLNTLASHGYLPRSGVASPQKIADAAQEGFNMENTLAVFLTWGAFLVDGNPLTNLLSIGQKTPETGQSPAPPAIVGGLNTHGVFEGDASTTRGDAYFGDNHSFNETLFQQLVNASNTYGGGKYNPQAAAQFRWIRIQDSIARNPTFQFLTPRIDTAYAESAFPYRFWVDGRLNTTDLDLDVARGFYQYGRYPPGFYRREGAFGFGGNPGLARDIITLAEAHPISPGHNEGVGHYVLNPEDPGFRGGVCFIYTKHVNVTVRSLYPNPQGHLRDALQGNLETFYNALGNTTCPQVPMW